ncbi:M57 family metalloprotease [Paraflavisolibacter sp. H34]|uniref:M57 family metalloprotease n=1 Tax=Huijunlia imazamoxiresistens TaxID=3127457 RepID=UPI003018CB8B
MQRFTLTLAVAILLILQSCSKSSFQEEVSAPAENAAASTNIATLKQSVAESLGVTAESVVYNEAEKQFVVEEDAYVSLEDAQVRFGDKGANPPSATTQRSHFYLITPTKVNTIKIYADATVPAAWLTALDKAIANWNATGSRVYMTRINTTTGATTKVTTTYSVSSTVATGGYPDYYGNPGNRMVINTYKNSLADAMKVFAITHELGHIIGFSHTNSATGEWIEGTPDTDSKSVMNAVCLSWTGFTTYDLKAVKTVYPK